MTTVELPEIIKRTVPVDEYIEKMTQPFKEKFLQRRQTYHLNEETIQKLRNCAKDVIIVVFSAEWCKDCASNVPVLALIAEKTGIKIRVFGGLKRDVLNPKEKWKIPPSPPEVKTFNVDKIPYIILFDKKGGIIGKIIENPTHKNSLEDEILFIIEGSKHFISELNA